MQIFKGEGEDVDFDYFYNREAERFNFLKVPEILVDGGEFKGLSAEAIILYSMLLRRTGMSFKNNWIDKEGSGKTYQDHYATLLHWYEKDEEELRKKTNDRSKARTIEEYMIGDHL